MCAAVSSVEDLSDKELFSIIDELQSTNRLIKMENYVLESYLKRVEPSLVKDMKSELENMYTLKGRGSRMAMGYLNMSLISVGCGRSRSSYTVFARVNIPYRIEITEKQLNILCKDFTALMIGYKNEKSLLSSKSEEICIRIKETNENRKEFDEFINEYNSKKNRISGNKLIHHITNRLEYTEGFIRKFRLLDGHLKQQFNKISIILTQKDEIGHEIGLIDFEHIKTKNNLLAKKLKEKNIYYLQSKKNIALTELNSTKQNKHFYFQRKQLQQLKTKISQRVSQLEKLNKSSIVIQNDLIKKFQKVEKLRLLRPKLHIPTIYDYTSAKSQLKELQNSMKVWKRKQIVQNLQIISLRHQVCQRRRTIIHKVDPIMILHKKYPVMVSKIESVMNRMQNVEFWIQRSMQHNFN